MAHQSRIIQTERYWLVDTIRLVPFPTGAEGERIVAARSGDSAQPRRPVYLTGVVSCVALTGVVW